MIFFSDVANPGLWLAVYHSELDWAWLIIIIILLLELFLFTEELLSVLKCIVGHNKPETLVSFCPSSCFIRYWSSSETKCFAQKLVLFCFFGHFGDILLHLLQDSGLLNSFFIHLFTDFIRSGVCTGVLFWKLTGFLMPLVCLTSCWAHFPRKHSAVIQVEPQILSQTGGWTSRRLRVGLGL